MWRTALRAGLIPLNGPRIPPGCPSGARPPAARSAEGNVPRSGRSRLDYARELLRGAFPGRRWPRCGVRSHASILGLLIQCRRCCALGGLDARILRLTATRGAGSSSRRSAQRSDERRGDIAWSDSRNRGRDLGRPPRVRRRRCVEARAPLVDLHASGNLPRNVTRR